MRLLFQLCLCVCAIAALGLFTACTKDGNTIYQPDPTEPVPSTAPMVTVIYNADALGDRSYNDLIYQGVERSALKHGIRVTQQSPQSYAEGKVYLQNMFQTVATTKADTTRRLYIVCASGYDEYIRQNSHLFAENPHADLLYMETPDSLPTGCGSTIYLPYYGAMYEAGAITPALYSESLIIASNPQDITVAEAVRGFTDGFNTKYYTVTGFFGFEKKRSIETQYLSKNAGEGYTIADSTAMKIIQDLTFSFDLILVPICGGSGMRLFYLIDLLGDCDYTAIDIDLESPKCPLAVLKHIDRAVALCIDQWISPEGMPHHQVLGLSSGFTEAVIHTHSEGEEMSIEKYITSEVREQIHNDAIRKEETHEE